MNAPKQRGAEREERRSVFDTVFLREPSSWREITIDEFFELPLSERVRHVLERNVAFWRDGVEIDKKEALAVLRKLRAERNER